MKPTDVFGVGKPATKKYAKAVEGCVSPGLIIGVELETENVNMSGDSAGKTAKPYNIFVETDGSLRGVAYEFISYPMRTDHCLAALTDFFTATKFGPENYTDRTSVHVHVNCTDMEMEQISSLALLYTVFEEIIFEFVGAHRDSNIYCIPWNQCRQHLDLINKFLGDSGSVLKRWNKYTALNLIPLSRQGTVEFRQMHGTADMAKLSLWINLIGSLFKWAKTYELKALINELKELNSNSQYEAFFNKIVSSLLPYNEVYREKLEQGVILAKYSLVSMEIKRTKPSAKAVQVEEPMDDWLQAALQQPAVRIRPIGGLGAAQAQADNLWNRPVANMLREERERLIPQNPAERARAQATADVHAMVRREAERQANIVAMRGLGVHADPVAVRNAQLGAENGFQAVRVEGEF